MRIKEESKEVPNRNDTVIVEDVNENEEENDEPDNNYSKQKIFGNFTNYGYTSNRTTTDEISTNTNNTVDIKKNKEHIIHPIKAQEVYQITSTMIKKPKKSNYQMRLKLYDVGNSKVMN